MSKAYSGVSGTVSSNGTDLAVTGFSADVETTEVDTTTTADAGWEDAISSTTKVSGSFDFFWRPDVDPFNSVLGLMPGAQALGITATYPALVLKLDTSNSLSGTALITKLSVKSEVKGAKQLTASFRSKGAWVVPTV